MFKKLIIQVFLLFCFISTNESFIKGYNDMLSTSRIAEECAKIYFYFFHSSKFYFYVQEKGRDLQI